MHLSLAFSPCPNDCFMFDAIVNKRIDVEGLSFDVRLADVETLNRDAFEGRTDVSKLSYHAFAYCVERYVMLHAGSALGRNCGPLLISKRPIAPEEVAAGHLRIAIPGKYTTANLLLGLAFPAATQTTALVFSDIESAVQRGDFDAGVIIHENRFTYESRGLRKIVDLGEYWEDTTGFPIPLGGIVVSRAFPPDVQATMDRVLRRSVEYAFAHPEGALPYVRAHAQDMDDAVMRKHIALYVNEFSVDLGNSGRHAVEELFARALAAGVTPPVRAPFRER